MNSPKNPSSRGPNSSGTRPTLTGSGSRATAEPVDSILQTLEQTAPGADARAAAGVGATADAAPGRRSTWLLVVVLAALMIMAWWAVQRRSQGTAVDRLAQAGGATTVTAPSSAPDAAAQQQPAAPSAAAEPASPPMATLETLPDDAQAAAAPAPAPASAATVVAEAAPSGSAARAPAKAQPTRTRSTAQRPPSSRQQQVARTAQSRSAAAGRSSNKGDPDIDLMAALMTHMDPGAAGRGSGISRLPPSEQSTIVGLVSACRGKPKAEAEACMQQICRGYWGKADACPVRKSGSATSPPAVASGSAPLVAGAAR